MFRENDVDFERINYFNEFLTEEKIRDLLRKMNLSPFDLLRKKEPIFKELNISEKTSSDEIIELIARNPSLLQRPIVEIGDQAVLARPIEKALELIK